MKDNFSQQAAQYAQFRPVYPQALYDHIMQFVTQRDMAWDCGCGNGQAALALSPYFSKLVATDISQTQLDNARPAPNIEYRLAPAEASGLASGSVNLVTVAQAIHWFRFEEFYAEVRRVARPGAFIAVWAYSLLQVSLEIDPVIQRYHFSLLADHWDAERKYVDEGYRNIPFPFEEIPSPPFQIAVDWTLDELLGYLSTFSARHKCIRLTQTDPLEKIKSDLTERWGNAEKRRIIFPLHLRMGLIN